MATLTTEQKTSLQLIGRSPSDSDGWREVSKILMPLLRLTAPKELVVIEEHADGSGRVRLNSEGEIVLKWLT